MTKNCLPTDYVELRCRSAFSFFEGASTPEDLVQRAQELSHATLSLVDRNGLYGAPRFFRAAKKSGIRAITGASLEVRDEILGVDKQGHQVIDLLVASNRGYKNLSMLVTRAQHRAPKGKAYATLSDLEEYAPDLIACVPSHVNLTSQFLKQMQRLFPKKTWVGISRNKDRAQDFINRRSQSLANHVDLPIFAMGDVRYARPNGRRVLDAFTCLRNKVTLNQAGRFLLSNGDYHLNTLEDNIQRFSDHPDWIFATRDISEQCNFNMERLGYKFPDFPSPNGSENHTWLRTLTFQGAYKRYKNNLTSRTLNQLEHELFVIKKLNLSGYFLIVHDITRFSRENNILCQGRGSAANSAVCYALGITAVDPIGMELLFERFLSEERGEWPDIDIDLPSGNQRERVLQYVFEKYGPSGAAMTSTMICYKFKSAIREMGKVLNINKLLLNDISRALSDAPERNDPCERNKYLENKIYQTKLPSIKLLLELVDQVIGLPRHLGQHTGGIVISSGRLDSIVPIEPARMGNRSVIQWDKDDCSHLGLIKIDLLGLGMFNALEKTLSLVRKYYSQEIDLSQIPQDDSKTYKMIQNGDTIGVFQIESRAQMATLPRIRPKCFYDLVVQIGIIRPGPITGKMVHPYINRRSGREPVSYSHPILEPILQRTLGIPIFQEQILKISIVAAGLTGGEAEEVRRAMGFKTPTEQMTKIEGTLRSGMLNNGISKGACEEILHDIRAFAMYGFPESHSASFALIAYASAYLRAHYPAAFLVGMLNSYPLGFYSPATLLKDAERHGVKVFSIDVTKSTWDCSLESSPNRESGPSVRLGLRYVNKLTRKTVDRIIAERQKLQFLDLADFVSRVSANDNELFTLAELGALESIHENQKKRRGTLWQVAALEKDTHSLLSGIYEHTDKFPLDNMTQLEETLADYRNSGMTVGPHIMAHLRTSLNEKGITPLIEIQNFPDGCNVRAAGHIIVRQQPTSAKGVCFLTLEDETGIISGTLGREIFSEIRSVLNSTTICEIEGSVRNLNGVVAIKIEDLRSITLEATLPKSHDYH